MGLHKRPGQKGYLTLQGPFVPTRRRWRQGGDPPPTALGIRTPIGDCPRWNFPLPEAGDTPKTGLLGLKASDDQVVRRRSAFSHRRPRRLLAKRNSLAHSPFAGRRGEALGVDSATGFATEMKSQQLERPRVAAATDIWWMPRSSVRPAGLRWPPSQRWSTARSCRASTSAANCRRPATLLACVTMRCWHQGAPPDHASPGR